MNTKKNFFFFFFRQNKNNFYVFVGNKHINSSVYLTNFKDGNSVRIHVIKNYAQMPF